MEATKQAKRGHNDGTLVFRCLQIRPLGDAMTRRDSLKLIGLGAASTVLPRLAGADVPAFPKGAVIRTILKDYAPEDLAGGATLFHEHMSQQPDFLPSMGRMRNGEIRPGAFE